MSLLPFFRLSMGTGPLARVQAATKNRFRTTTQQISDIRRQTSWHSARDAFSTYTEETFEGLVGTEISKSGFF